MNLDAVKNLAAGAGPMVQQLSVHIRFGSPGFAGSDPGCGHGMACQVMLWQVSHLKKKKK